MSGLMHLQVTLITHMQQVGLILVFRNGCVQRHFSASSMRLRCSHQHFVRPLLGRTQRFPVYDLSGTVLPYMCIYLCSQCSSLKVRNLSRLIWINVAVPPVDDPKAKGTASSAQPLSAKELRRKKVQAIKLCVCYAFAVKHYLRGEDGLEWEDYLGILPPHIVKLVQTPERRNSAWTSYSATEHTTRAGSLANSDDEQSSPTQMSSSMEGSKLDATKRLRVKRSKDRLKQPGVKSIKTPLLASALHSTIDFHPSPETLTTPLPLV